MKASHYILLLIVTLLFALGRFSRHWYWRSRHEFKGIFPVYSAATTRNKEAEFIRDRLPKRFPLWIFSMALLLLAITVWLLTH